MTSCNLHRHPLSAAILLVVASSTAAQPPLRETPLVAVAPESVQSLRTDPSLLLLGSGAIDPLRESIVFPARRVAARADNRYGVVQFVPGTQTTTRRELEMAGIEIVGYLPNNAFQVRADDTAMEQIHNAPNVRWSTAYPAGFKVASSLLDGSAISTYAPSAEISLQVHGFRGESLDRLVDTLRASGIAMRFGSRSDTLGLPSFHISVHPALLDAALAAASGISGVAWIEPYVAPTVTNRDSIGPIQSNLPSCAGPDNSGNCTAGLDPQRASIWQRGLTGHGQIVAVADSGLDRNESWFAGLDLGSGANIAITDADYPAPVPPAIGNVYPDRKVYAYWVQPGATAYDNNDFCGSWVQFHGTHVTGTVLGDAPPYSAPGKVEHVTGNGMAPGAQVLFQDVGNDISGCLSIADFPATLQQAHAGGASIHSDSWGSATGGRYTGGDQEADAAIWVMENILAVIAAGNNGPDASTTGSPANAKNVLTVGATRHGHLTTTASFSSRGPTLDGRRKPDITAPGEQIVSASGNEDNSSVIQQGTLKALSGTSMATPTVSGGAALARQYFTDGWYPNGTPTPGEGFEPSGSLLKAVLLNGTAPITTNWPSHNVGWGRLWLDNSLYFRGESRGLRQWVRDNGAGMETGDVDEFTIEVAGGGELRATLAWFDPEASLASAASLVNDLDLIAIGPDGTQYVGNDFYAGQSRAGSSALDRINSTELVRRITPQPGIWRLRVVAQDIPGNGRPTSHRQGYALVVSAPMGTRHDRLFASGFELDEADVIPQPSSLQLVGNDHDGIRIAADGVAGASGYQLYRADGTCTNAERGRFRFVAQGQTMPLVDTRSQGGSSYAYRMRAIRDGIEGPLSDGCVDVVSDDECSMSFAFDTQALGAEARNSTCSVDLSWQTATPSCPGDTISYSVRRDTSPLFSTAQTLATLTSSSFSDTAVGNGQPYYYQVEASSPTGFSKRTRILGVTPSGAGAAGSGVLIDDVDNRTAMLLDENWSITNEAAANGSFSYRSATGAHYLSSACVAATTRPIRLIAGSPSLRYAARYQVEAGWDGVVVELSADKGSTWTPIIPDGGYPGSFSETPDPPYNACGYPATQAAFNGESAGFVEGAFVEYSHDLSMWAGQDVLVRWRLSSDGGLEESGFFLDNIRADAVLPDQCSATP